MNDDGRLVQAVWDGLPEHYPHVLLDHWVIMPNHVHGIVFFVGAGFKPALDAPPVIRTIHKKGTRLRTLEEIRADILELEKETEGLLDEMIGRGL